MAQLRMSISLSTQVSKNLFLLMVPFSKSMGSVAYSKWAITCGMTSHCPQSFRGVVSAGVISDQLHVRNSQTHEATDWRCGIVASRRELNG